MKSTIALTLKLSIENYGISLAIYLLDEKI